MTAEEQAKYYQECEQHDYCIGCPYDDSEDYCPLIKELFGIDMSKKFKVKL